MVRLIDKDALVAEIERLYDEKGTFYAADVLYNLKEWLDSEDYGYTSERVILQIELLAETGGRPNSVTSPVGLLVGAVVDDE